VFSLAIAAGLLWIPYAEYVYVDRVHPKLALGCIVAAGIILWSIIPRRDHFDEPGPRITAEQHPRLFQQIQDLARRTNQSMPAEVYLIPEVNAWVAQRGGTMGFGSRRVMGLGVPLMRLLTVSQFQAVLAHEFGHYVGGDTALGPWIYKTRAALVRTLIQLQSANSYVIVLFNWYGKMFMRITLAISRAQEFAADRLGAQIAGAKAMIEGLKQVHMGGVAWDTYMSSEVVPIIVSGFCPPLSQGFHSFVQTSVIQSALHEELEKHMATGKAEAYDTHPALPERIAALQSISTQIVEDSRPATDLLDNYQAADTTLFSAQVPGLQPVDWQEVVQKVYVPGWQEDVARQAEALRGLTVKALGKELHSWELRNRLKPDPGTWPSNDQRDAMARKTAGCALALALLRNGWAIHTAPGEPVLLQHGSRSIAPFTVVRDVNNGTLKLDQWAIWCDEMGIGDLYIGSELAMSAGE
jgi:Zn-dependent protease with chaperone function